MHEKDQGNEHLSKVSIRKATIDDISIITGLEEKAFGDKDEFELRSDSEGLPSFFLGNNESFIAFHENQPVGFMLVEREPDKLLLHQWAIDPAFREFQNHIFRNIMLNHLLSLANRLPVSMNARDKTLERSLKKPEVKRLIDSRHYYLTENPRSIKVGKESFHNVTLTFMENYN
ncbi:MAG TPA: hypothetical protein VLF89_05855 [Candidatus Saccharimonadales bacterium]|nr:hypothetical protein [Candidatus Saccharimonadales bacterium]